MSEPSPLFGLGISVSQHLVGSKKAIRQGNTIYVSPAMYDLIKHANPDELKTLLEQIAVLTIPEISFALPMTTTPGMSLDSDPMFDWRSFFKRMI